MKDVWVLLAGVALFILGMNYLEAAIQQLSGRRFKLFLRKHVAHPLTGIAGGAVVTGVLQSSSVVSLLVLALVGAGTIPMRNALAVVLGANLGTTLDTWVVATIGFSFDIGQIAMPAIVCSVILRIFLKNKDRLHYWLDFLLGIGFLFFGLAMMKNGMQDTIATYDLSMLNKFPPVIFLLAGFLITILIQSSSATIALVLSALNAHAIDFHSATAIVLGSETGTTVKLLIASMGRTSSMKRVAMGNFLFNAMGTLLFFLFLSTVDNFIQHVMKISNPLIALSFFQTAVNLITIILFFPFLNPLGTLLEHRFREQPHNTKYISSIPPEMTDLAINALHDEAKYFLNMVMSYMSYSFHPDRSSPADTGLSEDFLARTSAGKYEYIKHLHGDIYAYALDVQQEGLNNEEHASLMRCLAIVRNGMYAAKSIKDTEDDIHQLSNSGNDTKYQWFVQAREKTLDILERTFSLLQDKEGAYFDKLTRIYRYVQTSYTDSLNILYQNDHSDRLSEVEVSTIINFNRELYAALKSLLFGMKDLVLTKEEATYFDELPGFLR